MPYGTDNHDTLQMIDPNEWENTVAIQSLLKSEGGITNGSIQSSKPLETEMPCDVGQASLVPDKPVDDPSGCQKDPKSSFSSTSVASEAAPTNGPSTHEPIFGALNDGDVVNTADDGNDSDTPSEVGGGSPQNQIVFFYISTWEISIMQETH